MSIEWRDEGKRQRDASHDADELDALWTLCEESARLTGGLSSPRFSPRRQTPTAPPPHSTVKNIAGCLANKWLRVHRWHRRWATSRPTRATPLGNGDKTRNCEHNESSDRPTGRPLSVVAHRSVAHVVWGTALWQLASLCAECGEDKTDAVPAMLVLDSERTDRVPSPGVRGRDARAETAPVVECLRARSRQNHLSGGPPMLQLWRARPPSFSFCLACHARQAQHVTMPWGEPVVLLLYLLR